MFLSQSLQNEFSNLAASEEESPCSKSNSESETKTETASYEPMLARINSYGEEESDGVCKYSSP